MTAESVCYFGYGSLVNRDTRPAGELAVPARVRGWRRVWNHRVVEPNRGFACTSLNIEPAAEEFIDGVLVRLPLESLPELDLRERGYERVQIASDAVQLMAEDEDFFRVGREPVVAYCSLPQYTHSADFSSPILQSYADCVMAGFERVFGDPGLLRLLESTRGWPWPRVDDRDNPYYPRAVRLDNEQYARYDQLLADAALRAA